jgi:carbon storage regulator CsrA
MLVLSRSPDQELVFPTLGITVRVLRISGNHVRLGIDAPGHVPVLRREVLDAEGVYYAPQEPEAPATPKLSHAQRNQLNRAFLALSLAQKQLELGQGDEAQSRLSYALDQLKELEKDATQAKQAVARPSKRRALLVEDDPNERELLAGYLRLSGMDVETAEDGGAALECLDKKPRFDVVLLDMFMPRCDGSTTLQNIRRDPAYAGLKVYAVTGHDPEQCGVRVGAEGGDGWFRKPVNPMNLVKAISEESVGAAAAPTWS